MPLSCLRHLVRWREILIEPFKFAYGHNGFYLLLSKLNPLDLDSVIIALEPTAHYGDNPVLFTADLLLHNKNFLSINNTISYFSISFPVRLC